MPHKTKAATSLIKFEVGPGYDSTPRCTQILSCKFDTTSRLRNKAECASLVALNSSIFVFTEEKRTCQACLPKTTSPISDIETIPASVHVYIKGTSGIAWRNCYPAWSHGCDTTASLMSPRPRLIEVVVTFERRVVVLLPLPKQLVKFYLILVPKNQL